MNESFRNPEHTSSVKTFTNQQKQLNFGKTQLNETAEGLMGIESTIRRVAGRHWPQKQYKTSTVHTTTAQ